MTATSKDDQLLEVRRERDFLSRLLELRSSTAPATFVEEALQLIVDLAGAEKGYLQLELETVDHDPTWFASGFSADEVKDVRSQISSGVVAEAMATGKAVDIPSALDDERFQDRESVRRQRITAVLCVPIGANSRQGVVYLHGRSEPGPFSDDDRRRAELFAQHLAPLVDNLVLRQEAATTTDPTAPWREKLRIEGVIGRSQALADLLREVAVVAPVDVTVLLTGESGTGKSQIARVIHDNGPRRDGPLVELNCATLPVDLMESELFGAAEGAYSGARKARAGKVAAAERGTLFLDEISELATSAQAKLLQLLQSRTYYPLGSNREVRADIRVIAATNTDLKAAIADGRFREDLYYRLLVLPLRVPSLRERPGDVVILAEHLCGLAAQRNRSPHIPLSLDVQRAIEGAAWPGNVRQLENAVEAAVIRAFGEGAEEVSRRHMFPQSAENQSAETDAEATFQEATGRFQKELVSRVLRETDWNISETARRLGLARSHVYNLIGRFGLR